MDIKRERKKATHTQRNKIIEKSCNNKYQPRKTRTGRRILPMLGKRVTTGTTTSRGMKSNAYKGILTTCIEYFTKKTKTEQRAKAVEKQQRWVEHITLKSTV